MEVRDTCKAWKLYVCLLPHMKEALASPITIRCSAGVAGALVGRKTQINGTLAQSWVPAAGL